MRGVRKDYIAGRVPENRKCAICKNEVKTLYADKLCGKCYLAKKRKERKK